MMPAPVRACFVTGTDTEVGKTLTSCSLLHAWAQEGLVAVGLKPVAAGAHEHSGALGQQSYWVNDDVEQLRQATSLELSSQQVSPYVLRAPVAPHLAARMEGVHLDVQVMVQAYQRLCGVAEAVVVEGVGGFCVPLNDQHDTSDLAQQLGLPVVLVVGLRLGCINHALLTAQAIAAKGLRLAAWVANTVDAHMPELQNNVQAIHQRLQVWAPVGQHVVCAGFVPRLSDSGAEPVAKAAATYLDWRGVDWSVVESSVP
jgi:dethiobiotin synthetase